MNWDINNDQDRRILKVIGDLKDEFDILEAWSLHLQQTITFPFKAEIVDVQEYGSIVQKCSILKVDSIIDVVDKYGIIVNARFGRKKINFSLCELEAIDLNDEGENCILDYAVWFANR